MSAADSGDEGPSQYLWKDFKSEHIDGCELPSCGKLQCNDGRKLLACARCKITRYCSKEHQRAAWPQHKKACKEMARRTDTTSSTMWRFNKKYEQLCRSVQTRIYAGRLDAALEQSKKLVKLVRKMQTKHKLNLAEAKAKAYIFLGEVHERMKNAREAEQSYAKVYEAAETICRYECQSKSASSSKPASSTGTEQPASSSKSVGDGTQASSAGTEQPASSTKSVGDGTQASSTGTEQPVSSIQSVGNTLKASTLGRLICLHRTTGDTKKEAEAREKFKTLEESSGHDLLSHHPGLKLKIRSGMAGQANIEGIVAMDLQQVQNAGRKIVDEYLDANVDVREIANFEGLLFATFLGSISFGVFTHADTHKYARALKKMGDKATRATVRYAHLVTREVIATIMAELTAKKAAYDASCGELPCPASERIEETMHIITEQRSL